ncbi:MAG TPA: heparinase II/III family protein, partial [Pyrinomonadaceae bacterium]|nr:heparinase II/III family protein [Pyrinomonadaceae bacterium]
MNALLRGLYLSKHLGPRWVAFRVSHAVRQKLRSFERRCPKATWEQRPLSSFTSDSKLADPNVFKERRATGSPRFFFSPDNRATFAPLLVAFDSEASPVAIADDLLSGHFRYFEFHKVSAGFPPQWHRNAFTSTEISKTQHWSRIADFGYGDIKLIWEPSRFASAYTLVRAWWRTGDEKYAVAFWNLVEDWRQENEPNSGVNWKCGQETALRVMAWCFGLYGFLDSAHSTPERVAMLGGMIATSAGRIASHIKYALSQRNNHGISEAAGLWTVGVLFPEFAQAANWAEAGRNHLENLARDLIYGDGAFAQHSANYHRLMLHDYLWVIRLAELNGCPFSEELKRRISVAGEFLFQIQDRNSGQIPCFGQNDGALILPLNNCEPQNYKPIIQAIRYLT